MLSSRTLIGVSFLSTEGAACHLDDHVNARRGDFKQSSCELPSRRWMMLDDSRVS